MRKILIALFLFAFVSLALSCGCNYHAGGCQIAQTAPSGFACHCSYKGFFTCGGSIVGCRDDNSYHCQNPDMSFHSCLQGGGDCDGYWVE